MLSTINDKLIGRNIRAARKKKGLSQAETASMLSFSTSYYARLERGQARLNLERLFDICLCFRIPYTDILDCCCPEYGEVNFEPQDSPYKERLMAFMNVASPSTLKLMCEVCGPILLHVEQDASPEK